ncbi:MAG: hypothetical protein E6I56_11515 [Chloroflexi bacterium]|nr:MAG: hypothetical protein E6I56_11515 [Chloroflexota bacterium]
MDLVGMEIFGLIATLCGLAAWTGRYRGWTRLIFGFMFFALLPFGVGLQLIALGILSGNRFVGQVGIAAILLLAVPLALLAPNVVGPAWYPRSKIRLGRRRGGR